MEVATKRQIRTWLDRQIKAKQFQHERLWLDEEHNSLSNYSASSEIHIGGESVRALAKMFDLELKSENFNSSDPDLKYKVFFIYKDTKFIGIESADEYKENGEV